MHDHAETVITDLNQAVQSRYLKKECIDGELIVTIVKIVRENVAPPGDRPQFKPVLYFEERHVPPLVLNNTNGRALQKLFGRHDFVGGQIVLCIDENASFGSKTVGG